MTQVRLHKWIATQGVASRRTAERWIALGRVEVNGVVEKTLGRQIDPTKDKVRVDGTLLAEAAPNHVYWMLHKPDATMTTKSDPEGRQTIYHLAALAKLPFAVNPVGRLDYRTEGVLLLSNDGELLHRLMHPKFHVPRMYDVLVPQRLTEGQLKRFSAGMRLDDGLVEPIEIKPCGTKNMGKSRGYWYRMVVHEGRNRLVRRLFEKLGIRIVRLVRMSYGPIRLPEDSTPGELLPLSPAQISALKRATELAPSLSSAPEHKNLATRRPTQAATNSNENRRKTVTKRQVAEQAQRKRRVESAPSPQVQ